MALYIYDSSLQFDGAISSSTALRSSKKFFATDGTIQDVAIDLSVGLNIDISNGIISAIGYKHIPEFQNFIEGDLDNNDASAMYAHAEGHFTAANGNYSHASGNHTIANGEAQTVIGKYNIIDTSSLFIIGNGSADASSNAMTVDSNGQMMIHNIITDTVSERSSTKFFATDGTIQDILVSPITQDSTFIDLTVSKSSSSQNPEYYSVINTSDPYLRILLNISESTTPFFLIELNSLCFPKDNGHAHNIVVIIRNMSEEVPVNIRHPRSGEVDIKNLMNNITGNEVISQVKHNSVLELVFTCGKSDNGDLYCSFNGSDIFSGIDTLNANSLHVSDAACIQYGSIEDDINYYYDIGGDDLIIGGGLKNITIVPDIITTISDLSSISTAYKVENYCNEFYIRGINSGNNTTYLESYINNDTWKIKSDGNIQLGDNAGFTVYSDGTLGILTNNGVNTCLINIHAVDSTQQSTPNSIEFHAGSSTNWASLHAQAFYQLSDKRIKNVHDEIDLDKAYDLIEKCSTIIYDLKDDPKHQEQIGVIAQEIEEFFPEIVETNEDGYKSVNYSRLTVIIMKVLKDLIKRVSALEAQMK